MVKVSAHLRHLICVLVGCLCLFVSYCTGVEVEVEVEVVHDDCTLVHHRTALLLRLDPPTGRVAHFLLRSTGVKNT